MARDTGVCRRSIKRNLRGSKSPDDQDWNDSWWFRNRSPRFTTAQQNYKSVMKLLSLFGVLNHRDGDYECINFGYSLEQAGQLRVSRGGDIQPGHGLLLDRWRSTPLPGAKFDC